MVLGGEEWGPLARYKVNKINKVLGKSSKNKKEQKTFALSTFYIREMCFMFQMCDHEGHFVDIFILQSLNHVLIKLIPLPALKTLAILTQFSASMNLLCRLSHMMSDLLNLVRFIFKVYFSYNIFRVHPQSSIH